MNTGNIHRINPALAAGQGVTRRTVDAPTRVFHVLLALSFVGAYLTSEGERWRLVHVTLGYLMAGLLGFRVVWGLLGPRHVRLSALWRKLQGLPGWVQGFRAGTPHGRQAQNLALALSVALLLGLIAPLALTGYAVYNEWTGDWLEDVHAFFGNALLAVVLAHVGLVVGLSVLRGHNLAKPMLTGRTEGAGPDLVRRNHVPLAALLVVAVLGFGGWQWLQAPDAPEVAPTAGTVSAGSHHHQR